MSESITISLNFQERKFIMMLAERGGRVLMRDNAIQHQAANALQSLVLKSCIDIQPTMIIGSREYVLTSIGTNIVDMIKKETSGQLS